MISHQSVNKTISLSLVYSGIKVLPDAVLIFAKNKFRIRFGLEPACHIAYDFVKGFARRKTSTTWTNRRVFLCIWPNNNNRTNDWAVIILIELTVILELIMIWNNNDNWTNNNNWANNDNNWAVIIAVTELQAEKAKQWNKKDRFKKKLKIEIPTYLINRLKNYDWIKNFWRKIRYPWTPA